MIDPSPHPARFVAFSLVDRKPFMLGSSAVKLVDSARAAVSIGFGHHPHTEVLDCGSEAGDVQRGAMSLTVARTRFTTVFRGEPDGDLPALPFPVDVDLSKPGFAAIVPTGDLSKAD